MKTSFGFVHKLHECKNGEKECPFLCTSCNTIMNYVQYVVKVMNMTSEEAKNGMEAYCKLMAPVLIDENTVSVFIQSVILFFMLLCNAVIIALGLIIK